MKDPKQPDREVFESVPWEELRDLGDTSRRRRTWYLVAAAAVVGLILFSVVRAFSAPDPLIESVPATTTPTEVGSPSPAPDGPPPALPPVDVSAQIPAVLTEADLRAGGGFPEDQEEISRWRAASFAEWFVLEFFTLDGTDRQSALQRWLDAVGLPEPSESLSYVEWVRALQVESLNDGRWRVLVGLRRLVSHDGVGYARIPTQAVEAVVDLGTGVPSVVDVPRFAPLPETNPGQWWVGDPWDTPPAGVIRAARDEILLSEAGTLGGEPKVTRTGESWRVEWSLVDPAGISWPVSLWIGPDGKPVPAGG